MSVVVDVFAVMGASLTFLILVGFVLTGVDAVRSRRRHIADGLIRHPAGKGFARHADEAIAATRDDWRHEAGYPRLSDAEIAAFWKANTK